jgi:hypothetical protein
MQKFKFIFYTSFAAFLTYFSMYAFRKPFTAGLYEGIIVLGVDYKIMVVTVQLIGYALAKVIGIRFISELSLNRRPSLIIGLIGISWLSLVGFAVIPPPYNFFIMFFNGLPLGLIWGIVFTYIEGRKYTELLAAGLSVSFIVSSGAVKTVGRWMIDYGHVSEFAMPMLTGILFMPFLGLGVWILTKIPRPSENDIRERQKREPMDRTTRKKVLQHFWPGIFLTALIYLFLTVFRDIRDNFAVDIWKDLGFLDTPSILTTTELAVAFVVLIFAGSLYKIRNNWTALKVNLWIIPVSALIIFLSTFLFTLDQIHPVLWMVMMGLGMYVPYITYHTMLLERWIASFKLTANVGFFMYIMDSVGYLTSLLIMVFKNFCHPQMSWGQFFILVSWITGISIVVLGLTGVTYFTIWGKSGSLRYQSAPVTYNKVSEKFNKIGKC